MEDKECKDKECTKKECTKKINNRRYEQYELSQILLNYCLQEAEKVRSSFNENNLTNHKDNCVKLVQIYMETAQNICLAIEK